MKLIHKMGLCIVTFGVLMIVGGVFLQMRFDKKKEPVIVSYSSKLALKESEEANEVIEEEMMIEETIEEVESTTDSSNVIASLAASMEVDPIVYDNMTMIQLAEKLNRSLNSTLAGKGELFATRSIELGVDPYLALAIVLHETGCKWNCSTLVKQCNNVGGQKGGPTCGNGSYKAFNSLDEGIIGFLDNLYNNYYAYGLTTPEAMNPKYAQSTSWAVKVNNYIAEIKAK